MSETRLQVTLLGAVFLLALLILAAILTPMYFEIALLIAAIIVFLVIVGVAWRKWQQSRLPLWEAEREQQRLEHEMEIERQRLERERWLTEQTFFHQQEMQREQTRNTHELERDRLRIEEQRLQLEREKLRIAARLDSWRVIVPEGSTAIFPTDDYRTIASPRLRLEKPGTKETNDEGREKEKQHVALPAPVDVYTLLQQRRWEPTRESLFLAITNEGPVSVAYKLAWHIALAGATGGGKTNQLRLLLTQMVLFYQVYYISPAFAPIKANREDWRPIATRLAGPVARKSEEIAYRLQWAIDELHTRQDMEYNGDHSWQGKPIYLVIDEYKEVIARYPGAVEDVCNLLRQARQYQIFVVVAAQDFLVKNIGGDSGARDCYRTALYFGGDPTTCRSLLDIQGTLSYEQDLGKEGHVVLRTKSTQTSQARAPFMSNRAVYELLGWVADPILDDSPITASEPMRNPTGTYAEPNGTPVPTRIYDLEDYRSNGTARKGYQHEPRGYQTSEPSGTTVDALVEPSEQGTDVGTEPVPEGSDDKQFTPMQELEFSRHYRTNGSIKRTLAEMHLSYGRYQKCASRLVAERGLRKDA